MSIKPGQSVLGETLGPEYELEAWFQREYEAICAEYPIHQWWCGGEKARAMTTAQWLHMRIRERRCSENLQ